jgi:hypothetical protein
MSDQNPSPMEAAALALYYHAAQLIKEGKSREEVVDDLVSKGVQRATAENMLDKLNQSRANVARQRGYRNILFAIGLILVALLPLLGIMMPKLVGVTLIIPLLMLAYGIFLLGRGLMQIIGL